MVKSGFIMGVMAFLFALGGASLLSPLCVPCLALFFGLAAGYLAGIFDKPPDQGRSTKAGALAGLMGGAGMLLGQVGGAALNGLLLGPEGTARTLSALGIGSAGLASNHQFYWTVIAASTSCLILLDVGIMAGVGALGGLLWWQVNGRQKTASNIISS